MIAGVVLVVLIGVGIFVWRRGLNPAVTPASTTATTPAASAPGQAGGAVRHPITHAIPAPASTAPLPSLQESDAQVADALSGLAGDSPLQGLLLPDQIIPRVVATVDALPRQTVGARVLPLHVPAGAFEVEQADGRTVIGSGNAARYRPYMQVLEKVDPKALVAWYVHSYPLFQKAYQELGYPHGYFNDRLIEAIDDMLAAPSPKGPIALVRPKVQYQYADPALQSLSAGQKLMLRVGPANEARIKARLRQIRAELTGAQLPAMAGTASGPASPASVTP